MRGGETRCQSETRGGKMRQGEMKWFQMKCDDEMK